MIAAPEGGQAPAGDAPASAAAPWISLLVPVFNAEPYLSTCLETLVAQAFEGVEVVCLDDASSDGSGQTLGAYALRHPGVFRLIGVGRHEGVAAARNRLLAEARGEFVWFIDADDELLPGALAALEQVVARHRPDLVLCDFRVLRERPRLKHRLRGEAHRRTFTGPSGKVLRDPSAVLAGLFERGEFHVWSKIVRRSVWPADLRFPVGRHFEDLALMPVLVMACERTIHVAEPWIGYRSHPGSALGSIDGQRLDDWWSALRCMGQGLGARPDLDPRARGATADFIVTSFLRMRRVAHRLGIGPDWARERLGLLRTEGWMPRSVPGARYGRSGRFWRWVQARTLGLD